MNEKAGAEIFHFGSIIDERNSMLFRFDILSRSNLFFSTRAGFFFFKAKVIRIVLRNDVEKNGDRFFPQGY